MNWNCTVCVCVYVYPKVLCVYPALENELNSFEIWKCFTIYRVWWWWWWLLINISTTNITIYQHENCVYMCDIKTKQNQKKTFTFFYQMDTHTHKNARLNSQNGKKTYRRTNETLKLIQISYVNEWKKSIKWIRFSEF